MTKLPELHDVRPGDIAFGPIGGVVPGFFPVAVGQTLFAPAEMRRDIRKWFRYRHVMVVVENLRSLGRVYPRLVQAMPSGAEEITLTEEHWTKDYVYLRPPYPGRETDSGWVEANLQASYVATRAREFVGTPYSFADYAAIAAWRSGLRITGGKLREYVTDSGHMICSQLADQAMSDAGWHVFDDGRLPQDVMPCELYHQMAQVPGTTVIAPGRGTWTL